MFSKLHSHDRIIAWHYAQKIRLLIAKKLHLLFSFYPASSCIGLYFFVYDWRHVFVQNVIVYEKKEKENSCFSLTGNQSYEVSEQHITESAINSATSKHNILPNTTQIILFMLNIDNSSIYDAML